MIPLNMSSAKQEGIPSNDLTNRIDGLLDAGQFLNMMKIYESDYLSDSCDSEEDEELSVSDDSENVSAGAEKDVETLYNNLSTYELEIDKERFIELEKMLMECDDVIKESDKHLGSLESFKKTISLTFSESDEDDVEDLELLEICGSEMTKGDNHQSTEEEFTENGSDEKVLAGNEIIPAISNKISDLTKLLQVQLAETDETYERLLDHQSQMQQEINENSARLDNERKDILAQLEDEKAENQREKKEKEAAMCRWEEDHQNEVKEELAAQQIHIQTLEELMVTQKETACVLAQIQQDERKKREKKSAIKIQSIFKMYRTKKEYRIVQEKRRKEERRKFEKEQENKRQQAEEEKIKREKEEEMKKEEKRKAEEEEEEEKKKKKKAEEVRRKMLDEEERKKREEEERKKREEEERKKKEEEERKKKEEEEKKKREEEERKKEEEEERKKKEEEEKKKKREEKERKKREEEERKKMEEEERMKREDEERKKREEEERKKMEEEERKKKEEERTKREVEEKKKTGGQEKKEREGEKRKKKEEEEEKRNKDAEERIKRDEEERRKKERERIRKKEEEECKMKENEERMKREKDEEEARMKREEEEEVKKRREEEEKTKGGEERKKEAEEERKRGGNGEAKKREEESKIREVEKKRQKEEEKEAEHGKDLAREEVDEDKQKSLREVEEKVMSEAESLQKIEREIQEKEEEDVKTRKEEEPTNIKIDLHTGPKHSVNVELKINNTDTDSEGGSRKMLGEGKMAADKKESVKEEEGKRRNEKRDEGGVNEKEMMIEKNEEREGLKKEAENVLCRKMDDKDGENKSIEVEDRNIKIKYKVQVLTLSSKNDQRMNSVMKTWDNDKVYLQPLPQILNVRRLAWMENCLPWGKISNEPWIGDKKNHALTKSERKRPPSNKRLPKPLNEDVILSVTKCTSMTQVTSICLKNLNGFTLTTLGQCVNLEYLSVNNCQLLTVDGLQICSQVKYIDAKNNNIEYVNVKGMESLRVLDLSYNNLALIHGLDDCSNLLWLNLQHNRITKFGSGLQSLRRLHTLLLGHNQLISTSGLQVGGVELQTLDLSHNQLQYVTDIEKFCLLRSLDVSGNNLIETPNLKNHVLMQNLQLSDNCLSSLTELSECWLPLLRVLNLGQNRLSALPPMEYVHSLKMIDIANNQLLDFPEIMKAFSNCKQVERFALHGNPLSAEEEDIRKQMIGVFPRLRYWDSVTSNSCELVENQLTLSSKNSSDNGFQLLCAKQADVFEKLQHNFQQKVKEVSESDLLGACNAYVNWCQESLRIAIECRYAHEYGEISASMFPSVDESVEQVQEAELILTDTDTSEIVAKMTSPATYHDLCCHTAGKSQDTCPKGQASEAHLDRSGHDHPMVVAPGPTTLQEHATTATPGSAKHSQTREDHRLSPQTCGLSEDYETSQKNQRVSVKRPNHLNSNQNDVVLAKRSKAATRIQAAWRGFSLRVKLQAALQFAQNVYDEESEFGEEIDLESFDMAEADLEKTWTVSDSPAPTTNFSVLSQPPLFRDSSHLQLGFPISHDESRSNPDENRSLAHPREAWNSPVVSARSNLPLSGVFRPKSSEVLRLSPPATSTSGNRGEGDFPDVMSRCKDDEICKEWGFKDARTAQMMLQRAKKMKFNAERREKLKKLDPRQRLALFRKLGEVTPLMPVKSPSRKMLPKKEYFQARQQNMGLSVGYFEMMSKEEQNKIKESRTYQWIHTQISPFDSSDQRSQQSFTANSSQSGKKALDTSQRVILYQKHQVTGAGLHVGDTSEQSQSLTESECKTVRGHRGHSAPTSAKRPVHLPPIDRISPSTMRREGSMSHWKPDVRKSGGWGGGKKRNKRKRSPNVSDVH